MVESCGFFLAWTVRPEIDNPAICCIIVQLFARNAELQVTLHGGGIKTGAVFLAIGLCDDSDYSGVLGVIHFTLV
jgi:hypothetical protein